MRPKNIKYFCTAVPVKMSSFIANLLNKKEEAVKVPKTDAAIARYMFRATAYKT